MVVAAFDVGDTANAARIVDLARRTFGSIDVLVNNAGHVAAGPISAQTDEALKAQFQTHVIGPIAIVREALPLLRATRGHVFMLGSGVARVPVPGLGAYPPAKAAVRSATAILRRELKPDGITVTYVDPGAVDTAFMTRAGMPGAPASILTAPEHVARAILVAVGTGARVVNAVPWQTAAVALAEMFPQITDAFLERSPGLTGIADVPAVAALESASLPAMETPAAPAPASGIDAALEPVRKRMQRVKLSEDFVRGLLVAGAVLDPDEIALQWAGMPNKNERAVTVAVLEALADAGILTREGERYKLSP